MAKAKKDIHQDITNSIIALIEQGKTNGKKLWDNKNCTTAFSPVNATTGKAYNGVNRFTLAMVTTIVGYSENKWLTYKQAQQAGWQVRKGEKSVQLCYYSSYDKKNKTTGEEEQAFFLKSFNVFNVAQIEGYVADVSAPEVILTTADNCDFIKTMLKNTDVILLPESGNQAFYIPSRDAIQMPPKSCFTSDSAYYSVILHEHVHSVGNTKRLARFDAYKNAYKTHQEQYAREELVAELGAAFLGAEMGCIQDNLECHASYIDSWLSILKNDKKAIFKACSDAQKASNYIMDNWINKTEQVAA